MIWKEPAVSFRFPLKYRKTRNAGDSLPSCFKNCFRNKILIHFFDKPHNLTIKFTLHVDYTAILHNENSKKIQLPVIFARRVQITLGSLFVNLNRLSRFNNTNCTRGKRSFLSFTSNHVPRTIGNMFLLYTMLTELTTFQHIPTCTHIKRT